MMIKRCIQQLIALLVLTMLLWCCCGCNDAGNCALETFIDVGGNKVHYTINGTGQTMVLLHGGYLDLEMWQPQVSEFQDRYRIIRFSDLGHGKTISGNVALHGYEILDKLSQTHSPHKMIIVGLSWGAMMGVDYTLKYPERVEKLILVSPGMSGWNYFQDSLAEINFDLRQKAIEINDIKEAARLFHKNWVIGPRRNSDQLPKDFLDSTYNMIKTNMQEHWQESWSKLDTIPARSRLSQIAVPTSIIIGEHDAQDILEIAREYEQRIPESSMYVIEEAAHLVSVEKSEAFNKLLSEILNKSEE